jgi:hypothetical protein
MAMRDGDRESRFDLKDVFDELMVECRRNGETDQKAEAEVISASKRDFESISGWGNTEGTECAGVIS